MQHKISNQANRAPLFGLGAVFVVLFAMWSSAADAVTLSFNDYETGVDLGATSVATLEANDVAGGVQITLTNTAIAGGVDAFLTQLLMTYEGSTSGLSLTNGAGVATSSFSTGSQTNAGFDFDMEILWPTPNKQNGALRLNIGESSTFTIVGATLDDLFQDSTSAMLHVQGLDGGGSTKYFASISVVPLPAAGLLLLTALGVLRGARRRQPA